MTWREFKDTVRSFMPVHGRRQGIQVLIDQYIRAAVTDLQLVMPALQTAVTRVLASGSFTANGFAAQTRIPVGVTITDLYSRQPDDTSIRYEHRVAASPGEKFDMVQGNTGRCTHWVHYDSSRGVLLVTPSPISDGHEVVVSWLGGASEFEDVDDVPFTERDAEAVSEFVLSRVTRSVEKDLQLSDSHAKSYRRLKRLLYLRRRDEARAPVST